LSTLLPAVADSGDFSNEKYFLLLWKNTMNAAFYNRRVGFRGLFVTFVIVDHPKILSRPE
jgi:hypothetical protein